MLCLQALSLQALSLQALSLQDLVSLDGCTQSVITDVMRLVVLRETSIWIGVDDYAGRNSEVV